MAEDLTIKGNNVGRVGVQGAPEPEKSTVPARNEALDRLRELYKKRLGASPGDAALLSILERRQEKKVEAQRLVEVRTQFESAAGKETLHATKDSAQEHVKKAVGTQDVRGADGLGAKDRTAVRGDPKAGPCLPPTGATPSPGPLGEALDSMLACLQAGENPIDPKAYVKTLREAAPRQPGRATTGGNETQKDAHASAPASGTAPLPADSSPHLLA